MAARTPADFAPTSKLPYKVARSSHVPMPPPPFVPQLPLPATPEPSVDLLPRADPPCLFQAKPREREQWMVRRFPNYSHTSSMESRCNWAWKEATILARNHEMAPPTHTAVVKFLGPQHLCVYSAFEARLALLARTFCQKNTEVIAAYWTKEIEHNNCIHYHLLLRTSLANITEVMGQLVERASEGNAALAYCMPVKDVVAVTRYVVKDLVAVARGTKQVLLFKKGLKIRICSSFGRYFVQTKANLWRQWKQAKFGTHSQHPTCPEPLPISAAGPQRLPLGSPIHGAGMVTMSLPAVQSSRMFPAIGPSVWARWCISQSAGWAAIPPRRWFPLAAPTAAVDKIPPSTGTRIKAGIIEMLAVQPNGYRPRAPPETRSALRGGTGDSRPAGKRGVPSSAAPHENVAFLTRHRRRGFREFVGVPVPTNAPAPEPARKRRAIRRDMSLPATVCFCAVFQEGWQLTNGLARLG
jgi:hypothetical protein